MKFTPDGPLARATGYTVRLSTELLNAAGIPLAEPFALEFQTIGFLEVSEVLPAPDSANIDTTAMLTVIFNRPVVPLMTAEEMAGLASPLTISPEVEGQGEWLNTSIYVFRPVGMEGGTTYTATIAAGLEDVTGGVLAEDYTWSFSTLPPAIVSISPGDGSSGVALDSGSA